MEFASRYVLEGPLLTTVVETFKAVDRRTHDRVLVHVFPAAEHRLAASSSREDVGQRFMLLTGAPVALRDASVDPVTGFAYVVTEEIASDVITGWGSSSPTLTASAAFDTAESLRESAPSGLPPAQPVGVQPGEFTREFMSLGTPVPKEDMGAPAPGADRGPGAFTRMFFGAPGAGPPGTEPPLPQVRGAMKERLQGGAFTRMFGQPDTPGSTAPQSPTRGPFTRMFHASAEAKSEATASALPPASHEATPGSSHPQHAPVGAPMKPLPVAPAAAGAPRAPATRFFVGEMQEGHPPTAPAGPSEYTRVVSAPAFAQPHPNLPPTPAPPDSPRVGSSFNGGSPAPPMPQVQGYSGMPAYSPPAPPPLAAPQVPPAPAAPQPSTASPLRSWMPFIILMNVLFLIALLLIIVFALKGR